MPSSALRACKHFGPLTAPEAMSWAEKDWLYAENVTEHLEMLRARQAANKAAGEHFATSPSASWRASRAKRCGITTTRGPSRSRRS